MYEWSAYDESGGVMRNKDRRLAFLAVFFILGLLLSLQFKNTLNINNLNKNTSLDSAKIIASIEEQQKIQEDLLKEINDSIKFKEDFVLMLLERKDNESLMKEWESVMLKSCLSDVTGPGIIIRLDDAPARKTEDPGLLIIHDTDIKIILNDLKIAGAQAISINGERIIATSEEICAGPTIRINGSRYAVPYIISAVGDADRMIDAMNNSERIKLMIEDNIRVEIKKADNIIISKYSFPEKMISSLEVTEK
jgi:uncharacterized protein YlxW (UPF0749 family)